MKPLTPKDPQWLGGNRMLAVIGRGGMGRVLLGRTPTGRLVAVKQIHPHLAQATEFRERFRREVQLSRRLTGAYTAAVLDADTESDYPWLATEYIAGPDLASVVDACGPLELPGLRLLAAGLAAALVEIHRGGLVHRDLTPRNVLLTPDGPRVIDFGVARALDGVGGVTATGQAMGSPAYMAPEQAEGRSPTAAADVFSLGAILATAATGSSPFPGDSAPQVLYNVVHSEPEIAGVPQPLRELVATCLAKDARLRPDVERLLAAVDRIPAESVWPEAVRTYLAGHRADSLWWVETAEKDARQRDELERIKIRRRRRLRWAAVAAVVPLAVAGTMLAVDDLTTVSGHAEMPKDPSLVLTVEELRLVDVCKLVDQSLTGKLGARTGTLDAAANGCSTYLTDSAQHRTRFTVSIGFDIDLVRREALPTGRFIGWAPILRNQDDNKSGYCNRKVITQGRLPAGIEVEAMGNVDDSCATATDALEAVVSQLMKYVPLQHVTQESILRVDPCTLLDDKLIGAIAGDPVRRNLEPHRCYVEGDGGYVDLTLRVWERPDSAASSTRVAVQAGPYTAYTYTWEADSPTCDLTYMVRPTVDSRAEVLDLTTKHRPEPNGDCAVAKLLLAEIVPKLPTS